MAQDGKRSRRIASLAGTVEFRAVAGGEEHPKEPLRLQHAQRVRYLLEPEGELLSERDGRPPMAYADDPHDQEPSRGRAARPERLPWPLPASPRPAGRRPRGRGGSAPAPRR